MNNTTKRLIALIQLLVIALSFCLNGSAAAAYNSGVRHTVCNALSDEAEIYYTDYTYDVLSEKSSAELLTATAGSRTVTTKQSISTAARILLMVLLILFSP